MANCDGWDGLFKDRVKLGVSPHTEVTNFVCRDGNMTPLEAEKTNVMVTVNREYLLIIEKASHLLECLDACGVCDWEGYSEAQAMYEEECDE